MMTIKGTWLYTEYWWLNVSEPFLLEKEFKKFRGFDLELSEYHMCHIWNWRPCSQGLNYLQIDTFFTFWRNILSVSILFTCGKASRSISRLSSPPPSPSVNHQNMSIGSQKLCDKMTWPVEGSWQKCHGVLERLHRTSLGIAINDIRLER